MVKASKLPSGKYRARVTTTINGKRVSMSFTAETPELAEFKAAEYQMYHGNNPNANMTFKQALEMYIEDRSEALSPSTLYSYKNAINVLKPLWDVPVFKMTNVDVQKFVNNYAANHTPKSVKNKLSMITATMKYVRPEFTIQVRTPKRVKTEIEIPTTEEVVAMIDYAREKRKDMVLPIMLGAFAPLRRSEIAGLKCRDVDTDEGSIEVKNAVVRGENNEWIEKNPKSYKGYRKIKLPNFVLIELYETIIDKQLDDYVCDITPNAITSSFHHISVNATGKSYRFHALRHYCCSILSQEGTAMSIQSILNRCGWESETMLRNYRHAESSRDKKENQQTNELFDDLYLKNSTKFT